MSASLITLAACSGIGRAENPPKAGVKTERFDKDPGWEGFHNRVAPERVPTVTQDFGYSPTAFAGQAKGGIGGRVTRSTRPAYCADPIAVKTLSDKLTASGTFTLTATSGGSGVFFGWFNAAQPGGGGRPMGSLGLDFDGEGSGARLAVRLISGTNKSCGTFITPYIPGKFRPTPIRNDGTRYAWTLDYDPEAHGGNGRFQFTVRSDSPHPEEFEGKVFSVDLQEGFKKEATAFDRFGLMNMMKAGGALTILFGDLRHDGKTEDFTKDPGWMESGCRATYEDREQVGAHDFGFSPGTNFAGGAAGEVGGGFWRSGPYGYYADRVGPLTLDDRLEAGGKVRLIVGAPDSDMYLGWFNSADQEKPPSGAGHFLGVHVGGPTRVGHYFQPAFATAQGTKGHADQGPVLVPGKVFEWSLIYDPAADDGQGEIRVTLGQESVTLALKAGVRDQGANFDRFGLFTSDIGGQLVKIFLDDLHYTAARPAR